MHNELLEWLNHPPESAWAYLLADNSACDGDWLAKRVDGAPQRRGPLVRKLERTQLAHEPLWGRIEDDEEGAVAPLLIQWQDGQKNAAFLTDLLVASQGKCALSLLYSREPLPVVAARLCLRAEISLLGDEYLLRYFDARILLELMSFLKPEQRASFTAMTEGWRYRDRDDQWQNLPCAAFSPQESNLPLEFDEAQQQAMLQIGSADRIDSAMSRLLEESPLDSLSPGERYQWIKARQDDAMQYQIVEHSGQLHFCLHALQLGDDFHHDSQWEDTIAKFRVPQVTA